MAYQYLLLPLVAVGALQTSKSVPKEWVRNYDEISQTIVHNDVKSYMKWMDKKFKNIQHGQTTGFDAYEKLFTGFLKPFTNIKAKATPLTYKKVGEDIVIDFHYVFSGDYTKDGKKVTLRFFEDGTDTWRKSSGRYLQVVENIKKDGLIKGAENS